MMADSAEKTEAKKDEVNWTELRPQILKLVLELGPLVIFYIANAKADIFAATEWFMGAMVVSLLLSWLLLRKVAVMPLVTAIVVVVFGSLTLILHDDTFIKMKPTVIQGLFALALFGGLLLDKPLIRYVMGGALQLDHTGWRRLSLRFGCFFAAMAVLNEIVWRTQSTDVWVDFKVFGIIGLTILFIFAQLPLIKRHSIDQG